MVVGRHDTDGWIDVWFIYSGYLNLLFRFIFFHKNIIESINQVLSLYRFT
jgi:hypothetical protein